jgi:ankyrin repeat protein
MGEPVDVAGANPRTRGPASMNADHIDRAEWHRTALHEACARGSFEMLKRLKPTRTDDLTGLLEGAALSAHYAVLEYVLDFGADLNDKPDGGSNTPDAAAPRAVPKSVGAILA